MTNLFRITATAILALAAIAAPLQAQSSTRSADQYNITKARLAIDGYDPVAYFPEGGGKPAKGDKKFTLAHEGVEYRFTSDANRQLFIANPAKYEPAHGGWCSYAMADSGKKVEIDPKSFVIKDGRLFLFYKDIFNDTRASWLKNESELTTRADANWRKVSNEEPRAPATAPASLRSRLDDRRREFEKNATPQTVKIYNDGVQTLTDSGIADRALGVGASAPDFQLTDQSGNTVRLSELLREGPVVLTWYRGGWCPYCNIQLAAYQEALPQIKAAGAQLAAITPELPDKSISTAEKNALGFKVLSDAGNAVARQYGLSYRLPEPVIESFKGRLDIPGSNGDNSWTLPLTATYVIEPGGRITWAFVDTDYRKRAEPADIVKALESITSTR